MIVVSTVCPALLSAPRKGATGICHPAFLRRPHIGPVTTAVAKVRYTFSTSLFTEMSSSMEGVEAGGKAKIIDGTSLAKCVLVDDMIGSY